MSTSPPSANGANGPTTSEGRDARGRFAKGWKGGPGNPHARRVGQIRSVLLDTVTDDDIRAIIKSLVDQAKQGDVRAASEMSNRLIGRPGDAPVLSEPTGTRSTIITTTPEEALEALEEAEARGYDPYCGDRPLSPDQ